MGYAVFDLLADLFYSVIGNPLLMGIILIGFFTIILMVLRANAVVILGVLIPLIVGIVLNSATTNFIEVAPWIVITLFIMAGFLFSVIFFIFFR